MADVKRCDLCGEYFELTINSHDLNFNIDEHSIDIKPIPVRIEGFLKVDIMSFFEDGSSEELDACVSCKRKFLHSLKFKEDK